MNVRFAVGLLLAVALAMFGQNPGVRAKTGSLSGQIKGANGQGLPDVTVIVEGPSTSGKRVSTTSDGRFTVEDLLPGVYTVTLESGGKKLSAPDRVTISESGSSSVDLSFDSTDAQTAGSAEIEIKADAPTIQTQSAQVSRAYETSIVRALPLLDRQYQQLIGLMPGVTPPVISEDRIEDPQSTRTFNVNGLPAFANAYFQDGSYQVESFNGRPSRIAPNESIQQLNILTSNYNGEYGFAAGSWNNTVTRPGTNGLHGSVFGLNTNRYFVTRNPLNSAADSPGFNRNQFGGSAGGPLIRNKTFIFGAYEGLLRRGETLQLLSVPSANFRAGNFSQLAGGGVLNPTSGNSFGVGRVPFPNGQIPATLLNPTARLFLTQLPLPNQAGSANNLVGGAALRQDLHRMDGKIDHRFSESSTGFFRYGFTQSDTERGSLLGLLGDAAQSGLRNHNAVASLTQSFTTQLAGEFRVGFSRYRNLIQAAGNGSAFNQSLAEQGFENGLPQVNIAGFGSFGLPGNYPSKPVNNTYDAATNWNWHNGMHHLKFGAQLIYFRADGFDAGSFSPRGTFGFGPGGTSSPGGINVTDQSGANAFASFLLGAPSVAGVARFTQTPTYRQGYGSAYITDTINLWKKAYLELGVRYDVFSPLRTRNAGGSLSYNPLTNQVNPSGSNGFNDFGNARYDLNNIAPRVGFVFRPVSRVALRAGYGVHYFPVPITASGLNQAATGIQQGVAGGFSTTSFAVPNVPAAIPGSTQATNQPYFASSQDAQTPYVQSYNLMMQADMGNGFLLDAGYVGNMGRQLPFSRALNVALPGTGMAGMPFASFNRGAQTDYRSTGLNSNFNSLQVNLTKRFAAGLAVAGAYTFGKSLDYGFNQVNPFNTQANYGVADWDRKHVLAMSHMWRLPFGPGTARMTSGPAAWLVGGWELNGILTWATGTPYSVTADSLACACPGLFSQPALFLGSSSIDGQANFNPALFSVASGGSIGSQGRNSFRGPDLFSYDLALFRNFAVQENFKLELRAEVYNLTNTTNFSNPQSTFGSPNFGRAIRTFNGVGGRQFQIGARLLF